MRIAPVLALVLGWLSTAEAQPGAPFGALGTDEERKQARKHAEDAWLEPCRERLGELAREIASVCPSAKVREHGGTSPLVFEATSRKARCGIGVRIDSSDLLLYSRPRSHESFASDWTSSTSVWFEGWQAETRTRFGKTMEVAALGGAKTREALLAIAKPMADACVLPADDGYQEYRLTVESEETCGHCIEKSSSSIGRKALVVHAQSGVLEYRYGGRQSSLLHLLRGQWVSESDKNFGLDGPLFGCGPTRDCVKLIGIRTVQWALVFGEKTLAADLTMRDYAFRAGEEVCETRVRLRGELVPQ